MRASVVIAKQSLVRCAVLDPSGVSIVVRSGKICMCYARQVRWNVYCGAVMRECRCSRAASAEVGWTSYSDKGILADAGVNTLDLYCTRVGYVFRARIFFLCSACVYHGSGNLSDVRAATQFAGSNTTTTVAHCLCERLAFGLAVPLLRATRSDIWLILPVAYACLKD